MKKESIEVEGVRITVVEKDFLSLTDLARRVNTEEPSAIVANWMRLKDTIELLGAWEALHNPGFKPLEFERFRQEAGTNRFTLSPTKWVEATGAIGLSVKRGRYDSGTFAHQDLALAFCSWLSPVFHLYVVKEFQRLKALENPEWDLRRSLAKVNYQLHTDAIREHIVPALEGRSRPAGVVAFSEEADVLNQAVFGLTAEQWRAANPEAVAKGLNVRDVADLYQLLVLANIEAYNEVLINHGVSREIRAQELQRTAQRQLATLYQLNHLPLERLESPWRLGEGRGDQP
jgi:hypothetical protein